MWYWRFAVPQWVTKAQCEERQSRPDNIEMFIKVDTRATLLKEICRLRRLVRKADAVLQPVTIDFSEALDGVEQAKMEADCRALFS